MYCWKKMLHNLRKFKSPISRCIADAMVHRESTLFSSTFFASVSVDPSNCTMLTDDQEEEAKVKILSLLQKQQVMFLKSQNVVLQLVEPYKHLDYFILLRIFFSFRPIDRRTLSQMNQLLLTLSLTVPLILLMKLWKEEDLSVAILTMYQTIQLPHS